MYCNYVNIFLLGNYGKGSVIHLDKTNLTRFDSTVFQFVLEQMRQYDPQESYVTIKNSKRRYSRF